MISIHKILVPTDFSEGAAHSLNYAAAFANQFGASLHLVHVVELPAGLSLESVIHPEPNNREMTLREYLDELAQKKFDTLQAFLKNKGVSSTVQSVTGTPHEAIVESAKENNVDMIVMGTHGHTGLKHFFIGSTAERVVRFATCPVTVVRHTDDGALTQEQLLLLAESNG